MVASFFLLHPMPVSLSCEMRRTKHTVMNPKCRAVNTKQKAVKTKHWFMAEFSRKFEHKAVSCAGKAWVDENKVQGCEYKALVYGRIF